MWFVMGILIRQLSIFSSLNLTSYNYTFKFVSVHLFFRVQNKQLKHIDLVQPTPIPKFRLIIT